MDRNKTVNKPKIEVSTFSYLYLILYGTTLIFVITSNLMLIYGFYKTSRPFTITTKLFIYLSMVDIVLVSCYVMNSGIVISGGLVTRFHFILFFAAVYAILVIDLFIFWTISFLRFLSIYKPMYRINTESIYKILFLEVFISLLLAAGTVLAYYLWDSTIDELSRVNGKVVTALNYAMIVVNLSLNVSSLILLRRSTNSKSQQKGDSVLGNRMVINRKKMALNTLLLITIVQFVFTLPATCLSFIGLQFLLHIGYITVLVIGHCVLLSYLGLNSLIILYRTKSLRGFYKRKCCVSRINAEN